MSLKVSTELLQFDVTGAGQAPEAIVEFSAAARTPQGGEVVLTVERAAPLNGPGGAADVETALTFSGVGDGVGTGELHSHGTDRRRSVGRQRTAQGPPGLHPARVRRRRVFAAGAVRSLRTLV